GLTGDAVDITVEHGRLIGWKPAFCGALVAAITATSPVQLVTIRPGVLPTPRQRRAADVPTSARVAVGRGRVQHLEAWRDDGVGVSAAAGSLRGDLRWGTIPALLTSRAGATPHRRAVVDVDRVLSYEELLAESRRCGRALLASGIDRGDRVAIWAPNQWRWIV